MNKKYIIIILFLLLVIEVAILLVAFNFQPWQEKKAEAAIFPGPDQSFPAFLPEQLGSLALKLPYGSRIIAAEELRSWITPNPAPNKIAPESSLNNFFFSQSGTILPWTSHHFSATVEGLGLDEEIIGQYLRKLKAEEDRPPQDAQLVIEQNRATTFVPDKFGQTLDLAQTRQNIKHALAIQSLEAGVPQKSQSDFKGVPEAEVALFIQVPKITLGDLNDLGIKEFLARGQSDFSGSSASRITNIQVGARRYQGLIILPGEEFSFNKHLGLVDGAHGFKPELVIKPEGTVPEFGGGLCQVSSTAFRAAFFAGLPITQRRNHSYAVKYYEWISDDQPRAVGLDATIYPGAADLKFVNDTPGAILVWTKIEGARLYFDFYGTPDGRKVIVDGPYEYDRKASGAVKSKVIRQVIKNGATQEFILNSIYVSPDKYPRIYEYPKPTTTPLTTFNTTASQKLLINFFKI